MVFREFEWREIDMAGALRHAGKSETLGPPAFDYNRPRDSGPNVMLAVAMTDGSLVLSCSAYGLTRADPPRFWVGTPL